MACKQWISGEKEATASITAMKYEAILTTPWQGSLYILCRSNYSSNRLISANLKNRMLTAPYVLDKQCLFCSQPAEVSGNKVMMSFYFVQRDSFLTIIIQENTNMPSF